MIPYIPAGKVVLFPIRIGSGITKRWRLVSHTRRSTASRSTWRQYQYETEAAALLHVRAAVVHRRDELLRRVARRLSSMLFIFTTRPPGPRVDGPPRTQPISSCSALLRAAVPPGQAIRRDSQAALKVPPHRRTRGAASSQVIQDRSLPQCTTSPRPIDRQHKKR